MSDFNYRGAIVRIRLKNFMTYTDTELFPGPNLNMILGPNGTGKSAIVCSIIVGLAGEVNLTGRGSSPADFVKRGSGSACTEIELFNDRGKNYFIERVIIITGRSSTKIDHRSEWKINGKSVTKTEVKSLTKKLDIKVDNLCQFLPQDSVTQFVKMNTKELLFSTLKASGDTKLVDDLQELVNQSGEIEKNRLTLSNLRKTCQEHETNTRRLESEVRQLSERDDLIKKKKLCSLKLLHNNYLDARRECADARQQRDAIERELEEIDNNSDPFKKAAEHYQTEKNRLNLSMDKSIKAVQNAEEMIQKAQTEIENRKLNALEEFAKFRSKEEEEERREGSIRLKEQELESHQNKLAETRTIDRSKEIAECEAQLEDFKQKRIRCRREVSKKEDALKELVRESDHLKRERDHIQAVREKKVNLLKIRFPDAFRVLEWLSQNQSRFQKHIFHPLMCEINVKDAKHNNLVEYTIGRQDVSAFVCQTAEDLRLFTKEVREKLRAKINVILAPDKNMQQFEHESELQARKIRESLNINYTFMKDLIDAPEPIMKFLCANSNFHRIPVMDTCSEYELKQLLSSCAKFFIGSQFYATSRSRYDNESMTVSDSARDAQFFVYSLDVKGLEECSQKLRELHDLMLSTSKEKDDLQKQDDEFKDSWQKESEKLSDLKRVQDQKRCLEQRIKFLQSEVARLKGSRVNLDVERQKLKHSIVVINEQILSQLEKLTDIYRNYADLKETQMKSALTAMLARRNADFARGKLAEAQRAKDRLMSGFKEKEKLVRACKEKIAIRKREAEEKIPGFENGVLDKSTTKKFEKLPETTSELSELREELHVKISRIYQDPGNTIMSEFNRQKEQLQSNQQRIAEIEAELKRARETQETIEREWLPRLKTVITVIDENYRKYMKELSYDGQVKLDFKPDDPSDFSAYGISILVRYRDNEDLIPLTSARQSGGERSVATMIYMLALQSKTTVPFRCVDEINQGMDKDNERKVFELLVSTADSSSSQYFLVSPKLLPNLPYSPKMKIHVVYNDRISRLVEFISNLCHITKQ